MRAIQIGESGNAQHGGKFIGSKAGTLACDPDKAGFEAKRGDLAKATPKSDGA